MTETNMEVVRILDEMSSLGLKLSEAWDADGNRDGDLFSTMPFKCSLDEWPHEVDQLSREYGCLPEDHNDDLNPTAIIEELVGQMGGEADRDNVVQAVAIQRAQAYLKRASWMEMPKRWKAGESGCSVPGHIEQALREGIRLARDVAGRVNPDDALLDTLKDWCDNTEIDVLAAGKLTEQEIIDVIAGAASAEPEPVDTVLILLMEAMDALKSATYGAQTHMVRKIDAHLKSLESGCSVPGHTGHALNCPECKDAQEASQ